MKAHRILLVFLAACGGGSDNPTMLADAGTVDSLTPDTPPLPPNVVAVDTFGDPPTFIRYRNGEGPWLEPTATSSGYEFRVDTHYELVSVCGDAATGYEVGFEGNTYEESGGETFLPCFGFSSGDPTHAVTGTMVQAGTVMLGNASDESTTGNWTFQLEGTQGLNDVLAVGNGRMQLQRNVSVTAPMTLPTIDVVQNGVALTARPLTINGVVTGDTTVLRTFLLLQNSFFVFGEETGTTARVAPASLLTNMDFQFVNLSVDGGRYSRSAFKQHTTASPVSTFTLLPRLENAQLASGVATWTSLPDGGRDLYLYSGSTMIHRFVSEGFLGTKTSLSIDTDIPGFMAEWKVSTIDYARFEVNASQGSASVSTAIDEVAPQIARPRVLDLLRARTIARRR